MLITQEYTRKLQYQCPHKKNFSSVSGSRIFFHYSKRPNFSFSKGFSRDSYQHKLMYFGRLHENTPENCSINVLKKKFLCRFQYLEYFSTTRNVRIFLFLRALLETHISINLCILVNCTNIHPKFAVSMSSKIFLRRFQVFEFLLTTRND